MLTPLIGCVITFVLSWAYARLISKMSVPCQLKWSVWALFGFVGLLIMEAALRWDQPVKPQVIIVDIILYLIVASFSMIDLNWYNIKAWGFEYVNADFYNMRFAGLIATYRNYLRGGGLVAFFRAVIFSTFQPGLLLLVRFIRPTEK